MRFTKSMETRVVSYLIRELEAGRKLFEILEDNYVRNRVDQANIRELLENEELLEAFEAELLAMPKPEDF